MSKILSPESLSKQLYPFTSKRKFEMRIVIENRAAFVDGYKTAESYLLNIDRNKIKNTKIKDCVLKSIFDFYGINFSFLQNKSRATIYSEPRMVFCVLMRRYSTLSYSEIGAFFSKAHCTVIHSIKRNKDLELFDKEYQMTIKKIESDFLKNLNN